MSRLKKMRRAADDFIAGGIDVEDYVREKAPLSDVVNSLFGFGDDEEEEEQT